MSPFVAKAALGSEPSPIATGEARSHGSHVELESARPGSFLFFFWSGRRKADPSTRRPGASVAAFLIGASIRRKEQICVDACDVAPW